MGKYYSNPDSHPFADAVTIAIGFSVARIDIFPGPEWNWRCVAVRDFRVSDLESDTGPVNTAARRSTRVSLMEGAARSAPF